MLAKDLILLAFFGRCCDINILKLEEPCLEGGWVGWGGLTGDRRLLNLKKVDKGLCLIAFIHVESLNNVVFLVTHRTVETLHRHINFL